MKKTIFVAAAIALSAFAVAPALAQDAAAPAAVEASAATATANHGQEVYTATASRIGRVLRVNTDGAIRVQVDGAINGGAVRLSSDDLSLAGERLVMFFSRTQLLSMAR